jgi:hypothetical protein
MSPLETVAPAFVEMAHRIVWCTVATVTAKSRPRSRILHPLWEWDGETLTGWIATAPTPIKRADLAFSPHMSCTYWIPSHDTTTAECAAEWCIDIDTRATVWDKFKNAPAPVGYDPAMIPAWTSPAEDNFGAVRLTPLSLRVFPGTVLLGKGGAVLTWNAA